MIQFFSRIILEIIEQERSVLSREVGATAKLLRESGLRATPPRVAVIEALQDQPHLNTDSIISVIRVRLGAVSIQAVYSTLALLTARGLVRRIEPAGSSAVYELRVGDNHHHVVCRLCQMIQDVDCAVGAKPCLYPSDTHGFLLDEAEVTYWGLCPTCQSATDVPSDDDQLVEEKGA